MSAKSTPLINGFAILNMAGKYLSSGPVPCKTFLIAIRTSCSQEMPGTRTIPYVLIMTTQIPYPEIRGTRTGYVIRFTCPLCAAESTIVNKTPRDHFRNARVASCRHCRKRLTVLTPDRQR
jgi:hypothetical protein